MSSASRRSILAVISVLLVIGGCMLATPQRASVVTGGTVGGAIGGSFSVQQGAASYSIPLMVPPGVHGTQPSLALAYDTGQGNGALGVGFRLRGVSAITRCGAQIVSDGVKGGVSYGANDQFCLSGERLIRVGVGEYRTQKESWQRVVSTGTCGSGPCSFTLHRSDGTVSTFGLQNGSRVLALGLSGAATGSVRAWMQDTLADPNGNSVSYFYTQLPTLAAGGTSDQRGSGQSYLDKITYGPSGGVADSRAVQFAYETRTDHPLQYVGGGMIQTALRLSQIKTSIRPDSASCGGASCPSQSVMTYTLAYAPAPTTSRSRLHSITQCTASKVCLRPTTFTWTDGGDSLFRSTVATSVFGNEQAYVGDFNGDGLSDILVNSASVQKVYFSSGQGLDGGRGSGISDSLPSLNFGDFNGDGASDVYATPGNGNNGGTLYLGGPSGFLLHPPISNIGSSDSLLVGDFNGDGLTDLLAASAPSSKIYLSQRQQVSFAASTAAGSGVTIGGGTPYIADFNGDGRADVLFIATSGSGTLYPSTETNNGDTRLATGVAVTLPSGDERWVADFNNDGLMDVMAGNSVAPGATSGHIAYGTGAGFVTGQDLKIPLSQTNYVGDFNNDGLADVLVVNGTNGTLYLGDGVNFDCGSCTPMALGASFSTAGSFLGDFNGDGLTDGFTAIGQSSIFNWGAKGGAVAAENQAADMLQTVVDGYGGETAITYKPITDSSVYQANAGDSTATGVANLYRATPLSPTLIQPYPVQTERSGQFVVSEYTLSGNAASNSGSASFAYSYRYDYFYEHAVLNLLGRGWSGFETVTVTDPQLGAQTTTTYNQNFPYDGRPSTQATCDTQDPPARTCVDASSVLRSETTVVWTCLDSQSGTHPLTPCQVNNDAYVENMTQVFYVVPEQATAEDKTLGSLVVTTFGFDDWGNLERVSALGDQNDSSSVPLTTCKSYFPANPSAWTFGFLQYRKQTTVADCAGDVSKWQQGDLQLEQYGYDKSTGNRTTQLRWDDQNNIWLGTSTTFTAQGLAATVTELSGSPPVEVTGTTYTVGHEQAFSTYVSSVTSPDPGSGKPLVRNYAYDARFGAKVAASDANGNLANACVDDFGRVTAVQGPILGQATASSNCVDGARYPYLDARFTGNTNLVTTDTTSYATDSTQGVTSVLEQHLNSWTGNDWTSTTRVLDGLGRTIAGFYQDDQGASLTVKARYLDASHLAQVSLPAPASAAMNWTRRTYDTLGRTRQVVRPTWDVHGTPTTTTTTWTYGPSNTVTLTEAAGSSDSVTQTRRLRYHGRQAQVHTATLNSATTTIDYDALARATKVTNPTPRTGAAVVDLMSYDSLGRVIAQSSSGAGTTTSRYDVHGNLCGMGDSLGQTLQVSWDPLHRRTSQTLYERNPGGVGELCSTSHGPLQSTITLTYDAAPDSQATNLLGHLATASITGPKGPAIRYAFGYDSWARPVTRDVALGARSKHAFAVSYDPQGRVSTRTYPRFNGVRPQARWSFWSGNGQLREVDYAADGQTFTPWLQLSRYSPFNGPQSATYGNRSREAWGYQPDGLLTSHVVTAQGGATPINKAFGWNDLQSIETMLDCNYSGNAGQPACSGHTGTAASDGGLQYGYDPVQRLTSVHGSPAPSYNYSYDDAGNLTLSNGVTFGYEGNQVQSGSTADGGQIYSASYNDDGEMTSRRTGPGLSTVLGLTFSVEGWLLEARLGEKVHERSAYDFRGRRVVREVYKSDGTTLDRVLVSLAPDFEVALSNGGGAEATVYLRDAGGKFVALTEALSQQDAAAMIEALGLPMTLDPKALAAKKQALVFHRDQVGSTEAVTDDTGATYATVTYDPWGTPTIAPADHDDFRPLFGGKEYSRVTGLYDFNARHYDTFTGRFVSADSQTAAGPLRPDGLNDYAYAFNNPVVYADPSGHFPKRTTAKITAKVLIGAVSVLTDSEELLPVEEELADVALNQIVDETPEVIEAAEGGAEESRSGSSLSTKACSCSSFVAGTKVAAREGTKNVEDIRVGDHVWSYNERTRDTELKPVSRLFKRVAATVLLTLGTSVVETTAEHPFYVVDRAASAGGDDVQGWVRAGELHVGDRVLSLCGEPVEVQGLQQNARSEQVYNFEVEGNRNYFVGEEQVLVHNPRYFTRFYTPGYGTGLQSAADVAGTRDAAMARIEERFNRNVGRAADFHAENNFGAFGTGNSQSPFVSVFELGDFEEGQGADFLRERALEQAERIGEAVDRDAAPEMGRIYDNATTIGIFADDGNYYRSNRGFEANDGAQEYLHLHSLNDPVTTTENPLRVRGGQGCGCSIQ